METVSHYANLCGKQFVITGQQILETEPLRFILMKIPNQMAAKMNQKHNNFDRKCTANYEDVCWTCPNGLHFAGHLFASSTFLHAFLLQLLTKTWSIKGPKKCLSSWRQFCGFGDTDRPEITRILICHCWEMSDGLCCLGVSVSIIQSVEIGFVCTMYQRVQIENSSCKY